MYERIELPNGHCPDCGSESFWEGPSGGACTNICCAGCLSAFNIGPSKYAERIPNTHFVQNGAQADPTKRGKLKTSLLTRLRGLFK